MTQRILIVDDSVVVQKAIVEALAGPTESLETVGDGEAALAALSAERPALLIADVHLPGANGYELARSAKGRYEGLPVVLLVGTFEPFDEAAFEACGADLVIKKPFSPSVLRAGVSKLIELPTPAAVEPTETRPPRASDAPQAEEAVEEPPTIAPPSVEATVLAAGDIERIARRVVELGGEKVIREVADAILPQIAGRVVRQRLEELEGDVGSEPDPEES
jgi:CheY-like chemotaxis protein